MFGLPSAPQPTPKPLITSDERMFPSLHPFGSLYKQKCLLHKRSLNLGDTSLYDIQPVKKAHTSPKSSTPTTTNPNSPVENMKIAYPTFKVPAFPHESEVKKPISWIHQIKILAMMEALAKQQIAVAGIAEPKIQHDKIEEQLMFDIAESQEVVLDNNKLESETSESAKENQILKEEEEENAQIGLEDKTQAEEITEIEISIPSNFECEISAEEEKKEELAAIPQIDAGDERAMQLEVGFKPKEIEEDSGMPGFSDKIKGQVKVGVYSQVPLPLYELGKKKSIGRRNRRKPELVWFPDEKRIEQMDELTLRLGEMLGMEITNQVRIAQFLKENQYVMESCLSLVNSRKGRFKMEFRNSQIEWKKSK